MGSLPKSLNYQLVKANAVACTAQTYDCYPTSGLTFSAGTTTSFDIPCGTRSRYLSPQDTYLRFTVNVTQSGGATPKYQLLAPDCIQSLQVWSSAGSVLLESIQDYNALHRLLADVTSSPSMLGRDSITIGADTTTQRNGKERTATASVTYCLPLLSVISLLSAEQAYLPINALNAPLRVEIGWASAAQMLATYDGTAGTYSVTISDACLSVGMLTISDAASEQLARLVGGAGYQLHSTRWTSFKQVHPAAQLSNTVAVPARFTSVRGIITIQRETASLENKLAYSVADRIRNYLASYRVKVGSDYLTPNAVPVTGTAAQAYLELKRVFSAHTSESMPGLITASNWVPRDNSVAPAAAAQQSAFAIGAECQPFSNVSDRILSGLNTTANPIYLELGFSGGTPLATTIDTFVEHDALFIMNEGGLGGMTVKF